jgi:hypothetical protein
MLLALAASSRPYTAAAPSLQSLRESPQASPQSKGKRREQEDKEEEGQDENDVTDGSGYNASDTLTFSGTDIRRSGTSFRQYELGVATKQNHSSSLSVMKVQVRRTPLRR